MTGFVDFHLLLTLLFYRHRIMNAATSGNAIPLDERFVRKYHRGLIIATIFSATAAFFDGHYEVYGLPPQIFCMNDSSERTRLKILVLLLALFPTIFLAFLAIFVDCKQYLFCTRDREVRNTLGNTTQRVQRPLFNQIPFRTLLFSIAIAIFITALPSLYEFLCWINFGHNWPSIGCAYFSITVDIVKVPIQILWTFRRNAKIQRKKREDRQQALIEDARQERLKRKDQRLTTIIEEEQLEGQDKKGGILCHYTDMRKVIEACNEAKKDQRRALLDLAEAKIIIEFLQRKVEFLEGRIMDISTPTPSEQEGESTSGVESGKDSVEKESSSCREDSSGNTSSANESEYVQYISNGRLQIRGL